MKKDDRIKRILKLKKRMRKRLKKAVKQEKKRRVPHSSTVYDDVFFKGVKYLDSL